MEYLCGSLVNCSEETALTVRKREVTKHEVYGQNCDVTRKASRIADVEERCANLTMWIALSANEPTPEDVEQPLVTLANNEMGNEIGGADPNGRATIETAEVHCAT